MAGSYLKSLQLQKQLEERAKEASKNRELAEKEYQTLQQLIKLCADNDVDTSEVEEPEHDFDLAMASKDYQTAIGQARKAQEAAKNAFINKIGEVGDSVEIILGLIHGAGREAKSASDQLEKSKDRIVKEDMEGAMKLAKSAYDSAERTLHEVFSELFSQAQETIMQAKEMGDDVTIFDNQMSKAKSALEEQEYEDCMNTIKEVLEGAGEDIKSQVSSTITRAEELLSAGEEFGTDMSKVKNHIERARSMLEGLKFKESLAYAKKAEAEGENAISSRLQEQVRETRESLKKMKTAKGDVTVPQQMLDQAQAALKEKKYIEALHALNTAKERSSETQFNSVLEVIAQARDRFVLAKKVGVDMAKAITLLNTSRDNLKLGNFQDAISYAEQSKKEVDEALDMFYKARDRIVELSKAAKFASDLGADISSVKDVLAEAREFFENKDYANTVETTQKGIAECKRLAREKTMEIIEVSDNVVKLGKKSGADMTEAEGILHKALDALSREDTSETVNLARSSHDAAKAAMTRVMSDKLQNIDQFVKGYPNAEALGDLNEMITQTRQYVAGSEFDKAQTSLNEITKKIESIGEGECDRLISAARTKVDTVHSMGEDVSDLEILLTRANDALSKRTFEDATARAREIMEQSDEIIARLVQTQFSSVKDSLEEAKTIGIDIEDSKIALKEARSKLDSMDPEAAYTLVRDTNLALRAKIAKYDSIKGKFRKTEELISEAGRTKVNVSNLVSKLENARATFAGGSLAEAERLVDEVLAEAERMMAMYLAAKFILASKDRLDLAQTNSIDVESPLKLLAKAKDLMKLKNYEEALVAAKKCDEESGSIVIKAVSGMILDLQRLLADAKNVGVDTIGPEKLAEKASQLAKTGDFAEALRCIASAREDIGHIKNLSSQAALEIRVARNNLKDAERLDMDVGKARDFLDQAVEALTRHQYAIALELARKSSEISMEVSKSRIWETLEKFKAKLEREAAEGAALGTAERCVADGIEAFKEGRYQESLKLAMACEMEMERAELQREISNRAVELARKKLSDAAVEGIKSDRLNELVQQAEELLAEGKYVDAMTASIESGDELHMIRENVDSCRIELSSVRERIERLKKIRIETPECDEILEMAQDFLSDHDFSKCRDALRRVSEKAEALFESSIEDVIRQNREMISKARSMGIDTKACEDLMDVANTSFNEKLWDFAYQQAMACRSKCLELVAKKITSLVDEVQGKIANLQRMGASTTTIEDIVEKARVAGSAGRIAEAFQLLMQVDGRIITIEDSHKKYMDISIAAESAIDMLGRFGMSKREPERLMAMADIEKEKDYDTAIELVAEALDNAKNLMESCSPDLNGSISSRGLQEGTAGDLNLTIRNGGKAIAKDVEIGLSGDFDLKTQPPAVSVKPGSEETVRIMLIPRRSGSVQVKITLATKRPYDGKSLSSEIADSVNVFAAGPPYRLGRASDQTRCISCQGRIKQGFDILNCRCGGQLHLSCAKRIGECPVCGQRYSF